MRMKKIRAAMKRGATAEDLEEIENECLNFEAQCRDKLEKKVKSSESRATLARV